MARRSEEAFTAGRRPGGRHLAPEAPERTVGTALRQGRQAGLRQKNSAGEEPKRRQAAERGKRREAARRGEPAFVRRSAKLGPARRETPEGGRVNAQALYGHFVPYIEAAHHRNERSLKAGVWLLVLLPVILVIIQELTDASRIAFLIFWIIGMFGIATALIFTAYADHDLKKTLEELKELVPPEEEIELGNLLPVDAEGEGWLIDPEELPIPLPDLTERLPQMGEELRERISERGAERQEALELMRAEYLRRLEELEKRRGSRTGKREKQPEGKHLKREK